MKLRIVRTSGGLPAPFPYNCATRPEGKFVADNVGRVYEGIRSSKYYYELDNGMLVHTYNIREEEVEIEVSTPLAVAVEPQYQLVGWLRGYDFIHLPENSRPGDTPVYVRTDCNG